MASESKYQLIIELITKNAEKVDALNAKLEKFEKEQAKASKAATTEEKKLLAEKKKAEAIAELQKQHEEAITDLKRKALPLAKQEKQLEQEITRLKERQKRGGLSDQQQLALKKRQLAQERELLSVQQQQSTFLGGTVGKLLAIAAAYKTLSLAGRGFKELVRTGFEFNSTLQTAELGVAAVIKQFDDIGQFEDFNAALEKADELMKQIRVEAAKTPATLKGLIETYQELAGPLATAGVELDKQVYLTRLLAQTITSLGIPAWQIPQEARAIITGQIDRNARAAKILQITSEDIKNAIEAGNLLQFLEERLSTFEEAGERAARTWGVAASNLGDSLSQLAGELTGGQFENAIDLVIKLDEAVRDMGNRLKERREFGGSGNFILFRDQAITSLGGNPATSPEGKGDLSNPEITEARILERMKVIQKLNNSGREITEETIQAQIRSQAAQDKIIARLERRKGIMQDIRTEIKRQNDVEEVKEQARLKFETEREQLEFNALDLQGKELVLANKLIEAQKRYDDPTLTVKEALEVSEERYNLELKLLEVQQAIAKEAEREQTAQERIALARERGLVPARSGKGFVKTDLSRFEQSRAGIQGQEILNYDPAASGLFSGSGEFEGGLDDPTFHFTNISEAAQAAVWDYAATVGTVADQTHRTMLTLFGGLETAGHNAFSMLIGDTQYWTRQLGPIAGPILGAITDSIARMFTEWIIQRTLMSTVQKTLTATETATSVGAAAATATAWTPAAILSSIGSFGVAAIAGLAAVTLALSKGIPGFEEGGFPSGRNALIRINEAGQEFVANASNTSRNSAALQAGNQGATLGVVGGGGSEGGQPQFIVFWGSESGLEELKAQIPGRVQIEKIVDERIKRYRS